MNPNGGGNLFSVAASDLFNVANRSTLRDRRVGFGLKTYIGLDGSKAYMGAPGGYFAPHVGLHAGQRDVYESFISNTSGGVLNLGSMTMLNTDSVGLSLGGYVFSPDIGIPGLKLYGGGRVDANLDNTDGYTQVDVTGFVSASDRRDFLKTDVSLNYEFGVGAQFNSGNFSLDFGYRYLNMAAPDIQYDTVGTTGAVLGSQRSEANLFSLEATYRFR